MKITALVSLAAALLTLSGAAPINRRPHGTSHIVRKGHPVPLTRNPRFKHNTHAQVAKLNQRYPGINILTGSSGKVPLTDVRPDLEYFGTVSVGTPAQDVKLVRLGCDPKHRFSSSFIRDTLTIPLTVYTPWVHPLGL